MLDQSGRDKAGEIRRLRVKRERDASGEHAAGTAAAPEPRSFGARSPAANRPGAHHVPNDSPHAFLLRVSAPRECPLRYHRMKHGRESGRAPSQLLAAGRQNAPFAPYPSTVNVDVVEAVAPSAVVTVTVIR